MRGGYNAVNSLGSLGSAVYRGLYTHIYSERVYVEPQSEMVVNEVELDATTYYIQHIT